MNTKLDKLLVAGGLSLACIQGACLTALAAAAAPASPDNDNAAPRAAQSAPPNIVLIFVDDMGYGDIGPFGSTKNRTPNLDRMAREGMKLTSFYAAPLCTASRTQIMTGCYAKRLSMPMVLGPVSNIGISSKEHTVADLLKKQGYATMIVGKWHLGDQPPFLPTKHGFDSYFGLPYSNDMNKTDQKGHPPLPLVRNDKPIEVITDAKQDFLEQRYTEAATQFIREQAAAKHPFFLYLAHTAVHVPLHPGPNFKGKSANGPYGDWIEEMDWSTGQVFAALRELGITDNTLVFFTADNGPWLARYKDAGSAGPLRGGKGSTFEGGMRESAIAWWPGKVPAGATVDTVAGTIDLLPTFVKFAGGTVPTDNKIDGVDISEILLGKTTESTRKAHYYFSKQTLEAVRSGPWKLAITPQDEHVVGSRGLIGAAGNDASAAKGKRGKARAAKSHDTNTNTEPALRLYNLDTDIGERTNVAAQHPDIVAQLQALVAEMNKDLGAEGAGPGVRPPGQVKHPVGLWVKGQEPSKEVIKEHYD